MWSRLKALSAALLMLVACSSEPRHEYTLMLDWMANPNHVPLFVGVEKGIFAKHGVPLRIMRLRDLGDSYPFLQSGNADLALTTMPQALQAADRDFDVRYAATIIDRPLVAFIALETSGFQDASDLKEASLGAGFGGFTHCVLQHLETSHHLSFGEQRRIAFDLVAALATEQVDVILAYWNIEPYQLEALGFQAVTWSISDFGIPEYHDVIVVSHGTFSKRDSFQAALTECIDYCKKHPREAFQHYVQANPEKGEKTLVWEERVWNENVHLLSRQQAVASDIWLEMWQWLVDNGCDLAKETPPLDFIRS